MIVTSGLCANAEASGDFHINLGFLVRNCEYAIRMTQYDRQTRINRVSRAGIGVQAVCRYGSGRIGYRAMYVRIGNPVVCSIDRT
jgi:hypothetical protein